MGLGQQTSVGIMSVLEEEEVAALRADLETMKREKEAAQAELARVQLEKEASDAENREHGMRFRRERSWGTSFDRQGGDNSAGRRGTAVPTMGPMWTRGVRTAADSEQSLTYVYRGIVPKLPVECSPSKYIAWEQRFEFFIANQGLRHTISLDASEIAVISSTNNAYLFDQFGEELVLQHRQVWGYISDATVYAPFESSLYKCNSISDALRMMRKWHLPLYPAERHLLVAELERVQFMGDEESEIVQFILRQFPERPSHPHALVVGRGCRDGGAAGVGVQRRDNNMASRGGRCLGSSSSHNNTGLAAVPCRNSSCTTGLATVGLLTSTSVGPMLSLPPDKRDNPNHYSYRHGESIRQEVTGSTAGTPFHHLRLKRCPTPVFSPLRLRRLGRKRPRHQRARHRRQYLQQRRRPAVLFSPLHQWGRPGRPLLTMEQWNRRRNRRSAVLFPQPHQLGGKSGDASRSLEWCHRTWQRRRFYWRSATTTAATAVTTSSAAVTAEATVTAAAATTPSAITTHGGKQPMLEHCCDPSILGKDANGMRG